MEPGSASDPLDGEERTVSDMLEDLSRDEAYELFANRKVEPDFDEERETIRLYSAGTELGGDLMEDRGDGVPEKILRTVAYPISGLPRDIGERSAAISGGRKDALFSRWVGGIVHAAGLGTLGYDILQPNLGSGELPALPDEAVYTVGIGGIFSGNFLQGRYNALQDEAKENYLEAIEEQFGDFEVEVY